VAGGRFVCHISKVRGHTAKERRHTACSGMSPNRGNVPNGVANETSPCHINLVIILEGKVDSKQGMMSLYVGNRLWQ